MLPSKSRETGKVGVGRNHGAPVLDCNRSMPGAGHQLPGRAGLAAERFKYFQMIRTGIDDARGRAFDQRGHKCVGLVESGWGVEESRVGYHANEAGQYQDGEGERFRSCRQTSDPLRIPGVFWNGVLDVGVYQDIQVGKQHPESPVPMPEPRFIVL